jgi:hypothetical protein
MPASAANAPQVASSVPGTMLKDETRVYIKPCINLESRARKAKNENQSFLAPAVVAAAIEVLVNVGVGIVKAAAVDETLTVDTAFPVTKAFYRVNTDGTLVINPDFQCLQVVTGTFSAGEYSSESKPPPTDNDFESIDPSIRVPRVFFEAEFVAVPGSAQFMALAPKLFVYSGPSKKRFLEWGEVTRNLSINLSFQVAGAEPGTAIGNLTIPFRNVSPETVVGPDYFAGVQLKPLAFPALSASDLQELQAARGAMARIKGLMEPIQATIDPKLGPDYSTKLTAYCAAWKSYVDLLKKRHVDTKAEGNFVEPKDENCPKDIRQAQLLAFAQKASLDRVVTASDRARELETEKAISKSVSCNYDSCGLTSDVARDYVPLVVSATLVEVREASAFSRHLAAVAEAMKPTVTQALKDSTPDAKEADAVTKQTAAETKAELEKDNLEAYYVAKAKADAAYKAWEANTDAAKRDAAWPLVVSERVLANKAARKAKVDPPFRFD